MLCGSSLSPCLLLSEPNLPWLSFFRVNSSPGDFFASSVNRSLVSCLLFCLSLGIGAAWDQALSARCEYGWEVLRGWEALGSLYHGPNSPRVEGRRALGNPILRFGLILRPHLWVHSASWLLYPAQPCYHLEAIALRFQMRLGVLRVVGHRPLSDFIGQRGMEEFPPAARGHLLKRLGQSFCCVHLPTPAPLEKSALWTWFLKAAYVIRG